MSEVKGSKQQRMIVVPYQPMRRAFFALLVLVLILLTSVASFYWGQWQAIGQQESAVKERDQLSLTLDKVTKTADESYQQVVNLSLAAEIDKASLTEMHKQVITLKQNIAELEESLSFYRGLMSPAEANKKLSFGDIALTSTPLPQQVNFKIVVRQTSNNHQVINGALQVNIIGSRLGAGVITVPLYQLSEQIESDSIRLRFKYFQDVVGTIILPEGFEPTHIELVATSSGKKPARAETRINWQVENF